MEVIKIWILTFITGLCMDNECTVCNVQMNREYFDTRVELTKRMEVMLINAATVLDSPMEDFGIDTSALTDGRNFVTVFAMLDDTCFLEAADMSHAMIAAAKVVDKESQ